MIYICLFRFYSTITFVQTDRNWSYGGKGYINILNLQKCNNFFSTRIVWHSGWHRVFLAYVDIHKYLHELFGYLYAGRWGETVSTFCINHFVQFIDEWSSCEGSKYFACFKMYLHLKLKKDMYFCIHLSIQCLSIFS